MKLTKLEQETVINYNNGEKEAEIYTYDRRLITKLKTRNVKLTYNEGDGSYSCVVPKRWIKVTPTKTMSDEERAKVSQRIQKRWDAIKNGQN